MIYDLKNVGSLRTCILKIIYVLKNVGPLRTCIKKIIYDLKNVGPINYLLYAFPQSTDIL
jgi:hypothetical protein